MDKRDKVLGKWSPNWKGLFIQVFSNGAYAIEELTSYNRIFRINGNYLTIYKQLK